MKLKFPMQAVSCAVVFSLMGLFVGCGTRILAALPKLNGDVLIACVMGVVLHSVTVLHDLMLASGSPEGKISA